MEKKLLEEINRFREIAGLELINEQNAWLEELIKKGTPRIANMDQIIKNLGFTGKQLTNEEIDEIFDAIGKNTDIPEQILSKLKEEIKSNLNLKNALTNIESNFVKELKNSRKATKAAFQRINAPINVTEIIKGSVKKLLDLPTSKLSIYFENQTKNIIQTLETLSTKGKKIKSEEDIWNIIDSLVNDSLVKKAFDDVDLSDITFQELKQKFRNQPDIKEAINKLKSENKLSTGTSTVPAVPKFTKTTLADKYLTTKGWLDDASETLPKVKDNVPVKVDDGSKLPTTLDEAEKGLDRYREKPETPRSPDEPEPPTEEPLDPIPNGTPDPAFINNFWFKYCKLSLCEIIIDLVRSINPFRNADQFFDDMISTNDEIVFLYQIKDFITSTFNAGDTITLEKIPTNFRGRMEELGLVGKSYEKVINDLTFDLNGWVNRQKSNLKMITKMDEGFRTVWENVKRDIRTVCDDENLANRVIEYCENEAKTSSGESIMEFILLFEKSLEKTDAGKIWEQLKTLGRAGTPEWRAKWRELSLLNYTSKIKEKFNQSAQANSGPWKALIYTTGRVLWDVLKYGFGKFFNLTVFGPFRAMKTIISKLRVGRFTNLSGLKRYVDLYIELIFITNVVEPLIEAIDDYIASLKEVTTTQDGKTKSQEGYTSVREQILGEYRKRFVELKIDYVPFYNPTGIGESKIGWENAPLPEYFWDLIRKAFPPAQEAFDRDRSISNLEKRKNAINQYTETFIKNEVQKINEVQEQSMSNPVIKKNIENTKIKYDYTIDGHANPMMSVQQSTKEHYISDKSLIDKLKSSLVYIPKVRQSEVNEAINQEKIKPRFVKKDKVIVGTYYPNSDISFVPNEQGFKLGYKPSKDLPGDLNLQTDLTTIAANIPKTGGYWALRSKDGKEYETIFADDLLHFYTPSIQEMEKNVNSNLKLNKLKDFAKYL